jgi:hypothetical protein
MKSFLIDVMPTSDITYIGSGIQIVMYMPTFDFLIMEETYAWTFKTFIGALGGAIGIWLGLGFGILIESIFNPIMKLIRSLLSRKGNY